MVEKYITIMEAVQRPSMHRISLIHAFSEAGLKPTHSNTIWVPLAIKTNFFQANVVELDGYFKIQC